MTENSPFQPDEGSLALALSVQTLRALYTSGVLNEHKVAEALRRTVDAAGGPAAQQAVRARLQVIFKGVQF